MAPYQKSCCADFRTHSGPLMGHRKCMKGRHSGGEVSGRKLNVLLGQDPDNKKFMDPDKQHFVCYWIKKKADAIKGGDGRLKKKAVKGGDPIRRSRRVEALADELEYPAMALQQP